ncbi:inactive ubiquitin thioesterase OTULINL-like [Hypanus sabinus]|uniref:inactive ubiquitin thioesterase OTULINL-like n=1 Tax=Hypanus sabinus TaxID=79690 RepID=UPI0028C3CD21|nr:inactive ubiquitin thioesterase OTULINL-like [Hypanus sabinus]
MGILLVNENINSTASEAKVYSLSRAFSWIVGWTWKKLPNPFIVGIAAILLSSLFVRTPYNWVGYLLKWPLRIINRKNSSVGPPTDLLEYASIEWKGGTKQAEKMKKAYEDIYLVHHIKHLRKIRGDNYCALRAVLFQVFSHGIPPPIWMREQDITKFPEKIFTHGCNWIQQYSFGPERYTGNNVFRKLRKYLEILESQWNKFHGIKDQEKRTKLCLELFTEQETEYKMYEAVKFLMLYTVFELHEDIRGGEVVPSFCALFFARDSSPDPLSFMMNHLNHVGDTGGLEQVEMFLLGFTLKLRIRSFRLYKHGTEEFVSNYPEDCHREWHDIFVLTEDDRHYNVPVVCS